MQFSIFGVPFKCMKDMFVWEKVKWSICVYWAQLWRGVLLAAGVLAIGAALLLTPAFLNSEALAQFNNSELEVKITMHLTYSLHYWYQQMFVLGIVLLCLLFVGLILGTSYLQYYSMFKKNYWSFSRQFNKHEVTSFWSGGFWKPAIFTMVLGVLIGAGVGIVLELILVPANVIQFLSWMLGLTLFHIFLHGGTWGFVPVEKQQPALTK